MRKGALISFCLSLSIVLTACGYTDPFAGKTVDEIIAMNPDTDAKIVQEYFQRLKTAEEKVRTLNPNTEADDLLAYYSELGLMRDYLGDKEGAIRAYKEGLEKFPGWGVGWNNVANVYQQTGDYSASEKARLKYIELPGGMDSVQAFTDLATLQAIDLKRLDKAEKTIEYGKQRLGEHPNFYFVLQQIYKRVGEDDKAKKAYDKYVELRDKPVVSDDSGEEVGTSTLLFNE